MSFTVTYTAFSEASPDDVFRTLMDIERWPSWDVRLQSAYSSGPLKAGGKYTLNPVHGNEITIDVVKVGGHKFHDRAKLEMGTVETERSITPSGKGCLITQTMRADVKPELAQTFNAVFWDPWSQGMIDSTKALANVNAKDSHKAFAETRQVERLLSAHKNLA
jgi:hypothetical protein